MSVPPVLRLDDHTLGIIFLLNTFPDTEFMSDFLTHQCIHLRTSRAVSQVCSRWRNMALDFPLMWADSLDLDALDQRDSDWRNLVMGRTKSCPLSVRGHVKRGDEEIKLSFFMELLSKEWPRIRRLNVEFDHFQDDPCWDIIETAADNIEMFVFGFGERTPRKFIFPRHLPSLRVLSGRNCLMQLHGGTESLCSLRRLKLDTDLSPTAFFTTLTHMNFLEALQVAHLNNSDLPRPLVATPINLPKLTSLSVSGTLRTFIFYLAHISDAPLRHISFYGPSGSQFFEDDDDLSEREISTFNSLLKGHFGRIVKTYQLKSIMFTLSQSTFCLETETTGSVYPSLIISYCQGMSALSLLQPTSEALSMGDLSNTTMLALGSNMYADDFEFTGVTTGCLLKFFNSLESVSRLKINTASVLRVLRDIQRQNKDGMVILPRLENLVFTNLLFADRPDPDKVIQFLNERKKLGQPIQLIEFEDCDVDLEGGNFSFLKDMEDIVIKYANTVADDSDV